MEFDRERSVHVHVHDKSTNENRQRRGVIKPAVWKPLNPDSTPPHIPA